MAHRPWGVKAEPLRFLGRLVVVREGWTHRHSFFRLLKHVDFLFFFLWLEYVILWVWGVKYSTLEIAAVSSVDMVDLLYVDLI